MYIYTYIIMDIIYEYLWELYVILEQLELVIRLR